MRERMIDGAIRCIYVMSWIYLFLLIIVEYA